MRFKVPTVLGISAPAALLAALALAGCGKLGSQDPQAQAAQQWPLVNKYCSDCHNASDLAGGLDFAKIKPENFAQHAETLEKAVRKLRGNLMPPPKEPRPDEARLMSFVSWLENSLDAVAASEHGYPAIAPQRLNRKEYSNAVRDLLALDVDAAEFLPQDEEVRHFDNIARGLQVSPSFIEQYVIAARAVAVRAVGQPNARPGSKTYTAGAGNQLTHVKGLPLGTRGGVAVTHLFPSDGDYAINVADLFTAIWGNDSEFENKLVVTLDDKPIYETSLGGEEDMKLYDQVQDGAMEKVNSRLKNIRFAATSGPHRVGVTFQRRTFAESDDQLQMFLPGGGQDRQFRLSSFEISGPYGAHGLSETPSRDRIFTCEPSKGDDAQICAEQIITRLATKAYRRPLAETDLADLLEYYPRRRRAGRLRGGHPGRDHRHPREPVLPLSRRAGAGERGAGANVCDRRPHARVEAVVLLLELDSRRRAARGRDARRAAQGRSAEARGCADAQGSARGVAREQLRVPLAQHAPARRGRPGSRDFSVRVGPRRPAPRLHDRAHAVLEEHLRREPTRHGFHDGEVHVLE